MTDRARPAKAGAATKILVTGASVAAGLGLIGLLDGAVAEGGSVAPEAPQTTIIRRVVVATPEPDILLQSSMGGTRIVVQAAPAPIIRVRSAPTGSSAPPPAQSKSSGS